MLSPGVKRQGKHLGPLHPVPWRGADPQARGPCPPSHYTLHTAHYTLHSTLFKLHTTHYTLHTTHYTLTSVHSTRCRGEALILRHGVGLGGAGGAVGEVPLPCGEQHLRNGFTV